MASFYCSLSKTNQLQLSPLPGGRKHNCKLLKKTKVQLIFLIQNHNA